TSSPGALDSASRRACRRKSPPAPRDRGPGGSAWLLRFRSLDFWKQKAIRRGSTRMTRIKQGGRTHRAPPRSLSCFVRDHPCKPLARNQRAYTSVEGKKYAISTAAVSGAS